MTPPRGRRPTGEQTRRRAPCRSTDPTLEPLNRLVSTWTTDATHPAYPGGVVHGTAVIEWLEGERFLIHRARTDHPDFPDSISLIAITELDRVADPPSDDPAAAIEPTLHMPYFASRRVFGVSDT